MLVSERVELDLYSTGPGGLLGAPFLAALPVGQRLGSGPFQNLMVLGQIAPAVSHHFGVEGRHPQPFPPLLPGV